MDLEDKVVIVTGASRGIGRATAVEFGREGARLVLAARSEGDLEETEDLVEEVGGSAMVVPTDVTSEDDVGKLFDIAEQHYNDDIDVVVNNAGFGVRKPLEDHSLEDFEKCIGVNVKGVFLCCREAVQRMGDGVILNVASGAGKNGHPGMSVYSASKFAVVGFTEALAGEWDGKVMAPCPGPTDTDMYRRCFPEKDYKDCDDPETVAKRMVKLVKHDKLHGSGSAPNVWKPVM